MMNWPCEGIEPWPNWSCPLQHMADVYKQTTSISKFQREVNYSPHYSSLIVTCSNYIDPSF